MKPYDAAMAAFRVASKNERLAAHLYRNRVLCQTEYLDIRAKLDAAGLVVDAAVAALPRHTDACTDANDRSAREVCICPGGPDA